MHIARVKLSATAFETKGIIRHGWIILKFSKSNLKAIRGNSSNKFANDSVNENPVFTERGLRCHAARAGDGKFAFS